MDEDISLSLSSMVIGSVDTLRGTQLDLLIPNTWNEQPPLLTGPRQEGETTNLLKGMVRRGIPPALRCAVWLSNVIQTVHPHQDMSYWHEYRTLAKARALDHAYNHIFDDVIQQQQWDSVETPTYGRRPDALQVPDATPAGRLAQKRVLIALARIVGIEYAPLVPTLVALLLTAMSESYCFCTLREMTHQIAYYFPISHREYVSWCRAFADVMHKLHKSTANYLEDRCVLDHEQLSPIFQDFFVGILPIPYVLRILDIYTLEGSKALFRFGVALLVMYKIEAHEQLITISNATEWWDGMGAWGHGSRFNFEVVVRKAYGLHGRGIRRQLRFPRRQILQRIIRVEEQRLAQQGMDDSQYSESQAPPLGLIEPNESTVEFGKELVKPILAQSTQRRTFLANWLPLTLRMTNLELIYSTNYHGRALQMFYRAVKRANHTILLCEAFPSTMKGGIESNARPTIIGLYASQAWRESPQVYGDGCCFLFRLEPDPECWKWKPRPSHGEHLLDSVDLEDYEGSETENQTALLEQFMVGTKSYISMGGNRDGSAGFRLNEDMTKGESSTAAGFDNEPLHGKEIGSVFEVGLVEVYALVRQIDGRAT